MASLKDFCIANSISIEKLNELVNKNGITYKDIFVIDESNINNKSGWRASYESIQIIACTAEEYK